jgi:hypothetical protein
MQNQVLLPLLLALLASCVLQGGSSSKGSDGSVLQKTDGGALADAHHSPDAHVAKDAGQSSDADHVGHDGGGITDSGIPVLDGDIIFVDAGSCCHDASYITDAGYVTEDGGSWGVPDAQVFP